MTTGLIAIKAINQYRRRDILPYLGLRYYLMNSSAKRDRWIQEVAPYLVLSGRQTSYFKTYHFKGVNEEGGFVHRIIDVPGPNEALGEIALLTECSKHLSFVSHDFVYSYRFAPAASTDGVFEYYFDGYKSRHKAIAASCHDATCQEVFCTDIIKFYPSILPEVAFSSWDKTCRKSNISDKWFKLGNKILENHSDKGVHDSTSKCLLTGPFFSHLIANLALHEIDSKMNSVTNKRYWRYVDDIAMCGTSEEICRWSDILESSINDLGLCLHNGDKKFTVETCKWLRTENDFDDDIGILWMSLIANVKRFLLANLDKLEELKKVFLDCDIRIPIQNYSLNMYESTVLEKILNWYKNNKWARRTTNSITIQGLVKSAIEARAYYKNLIACSLDSIDSLDSFDRKRIFSKIRYCSGRLIVLDSRESLIQLSEAIKKYPELYFLSEIMKAIGCRDVSVIARMGTNAAQAVAQLLSLSRETVQMHVDDLDEISDQVLSILVLNGVNVEQNIKSSSPLYNFATENNLRELMISSDLFIRELSCLHGVSDSNFHRKIFDTAFDKNEVLAIDVINQLQPSSYL